MVDKGEPKVWIEKAKTLPQKELEIEVAKSNPDKKIREKLNPVSENLVRFECGLSYKGKEKVERSRVVLAKKWQRTVTYGEVVEHLTDEFLEANDPIKKAERNFSRHSPSERVTESKNPHYISAAVLHQVNLRDRGKCAERHPDGTRCGSEMFTEIHHIVLVSEGGKSVLENLITLCSAHHKLRHEPWDMPRAQLGQVPCSPPQS